MPEVGRMSDGKRRRVLYCKPKLNSMRPGFPRDPAFCVTQTRHGMTVRRAPRASGEYLPGDRSGYMSSLSNDSPLRPVRRERRFPFSTVDGPCYGILNSKDGTKKPYETV